MSAQVVRALALGAGIGVLFLFAACSHLEGRHAADDELAGFDGCPPGDECPGHDPKVCVKPTVHALAHDLDHLEKHIDWFGSVVAKVPDVWGQARLTRYREEFEEQMATELTKFDVMLQGSVARTDQAFFAQAVALSAAAAPPVLPPQARTTTTITNVDNSGLTSSEVLDAVTRASRGVEGTTTTGFTAQGVPAGEGTRSASDTTTVSQSGGQDLTDTRNLTRTRNASRGFDQQTVIASPTVIAGPATDAASILSGGGITQNAVAAPVALPISYFTKGAGLEQTVVLEQRRRYLNYLNQLRRENEGDDKADAPGYSLNLMRIPVSVLPGKKTDIGHGAEITFTVDPVLGDDLLPMTYRNFVVNDLVQHLGFPLVKFLEDREEAVEYLSEQNRALLARPNVRQYLASPGRSVEGFRVGRARGVVDYGRFEALTQKKIETPTLSFANGLNNRLPFPVSQMVEVYGLRNCFEIAYRANQALGRDIDRRGYVPLPDMQAYLREEATAAYQLLAHPNNQHLWETFCTPELVAAVRSRQYSASQPGMRDTTLLGMRDRFRDAVQQLTLSPDQPGSDGFPPAQQYSVTAALAWCIIVDAALLTDRLVRDMREVASAKGQGLPHAGEWLPYFLPCPPPEAREAFNSYVKLRWPVYVFALDPVTQDQNLADTLATRREMQLALSVAFTRGVINANSLTRYARRLEAQYDTIALNRTQVGFTHGENTFGWRFYPRFQTPDTPSNLTVFFRDQLIGGPNRNQLLRQRRLEPGARECVALVVMPSFVPYITVDSVANWFALPNPKHKSLDHTQAVKMSRTVRALQNCEHNVTDADCYRDGELQRLQKRVEQLANRLPTQTLTTPVPILNTLGGFEMFSNGTTDLAPELYGWYGAPGIDRDTGTTLFLVGDHFSTLRTQVIVGNKEVAKEHQRMLSRQIMQVTIAPGVMTVKDPADGRVYAQAHVATPYGVTRELLIPIVEKPAEKPPAAAPAEGFTVVPEKLTVTYRLTHAGDGKYLPAVLRVNDDLAVAWSDATGSMPKALRVALVFDRGNNTTLTIPCEVTYGPPVPGTAPGAVIDATVGLRRSSFVLAEADLRKVMAELVAKLAPVPFAPGENPLAPALTTARVIVAPLPDGTHAVQEKDAGNKLTIEFKGEFDPACPPVGPQFIAPVAPDPPVGPMPAADPAKDLPKKNGAALGPPPMPRPAAHADGADGRPAAVLPPPGPLPSVGR